jgi:hypothetical protein
MGADAILGIALGLLILFAFALVGAIVLADKVLRDTGEVEVEVTAPSLSFRLYVKRSRS